MAREPHYPDDAPVGDVKKATRAASGRGGAGEPAAESEVGETADTSRPADTRRTKQIVAGAAIGIGSAAIVAALLWTRTRGKSDKS